MSKIIEGIFNQLIKDKVIVLKGDDILYCINPNEIWSIYTKYFPGKCYADFKVNLAKLTDTVPHKKLGLLCSKKPIKAHPQGSRALQHLLERLTLALTLNEIDLVFQEKEKPTSF